MRVGVSRMGGECGALLNGCARGCSFVDRILVVRTLFAQQRALRSFAHHAGGCVVLDVAGVEGYSVSLIEWKVESRPSASNRQSKRH